MSKVNTKRTGTKLGIALLLVMTGCSASGDADERSMSEEVTPVRDPADVMIENEELLNPVARVDVSGVGSVRFYEPEPGLILIGEGGLGKRLLGPETKTMSPVEKYEHLTGHPAPQELMEAAARAEAAREIAPQASEEQVDSEQRELAPRLAPRQKDHISDEFLAGYCDTHNWSTADHQAFWTFVTGTGSIHWSRLDWVQSAARSRVGTTIRFRARVKKCALCQWGSYSTVYLSNGQSWIFVFGDNDKNFQWNAVVDQAEGDIYDFCSFGND